MEIGLNNFDLFTTQTWLFWLCQHLATCKAEFQGPWEQKYYLNSSFRSKVASRLASRTTVTSLCISLAQLSAIGLWDSEHEATWVFGLTPLMAILWGIKSLWRQKQISYRWSVQVIVREDQTTVLYFIHEHECHKRNEASKNKQSVS